MCCFLWSTFNPCWFYYGACALSPSVISVVCFGELPSSRFTVSSKKRSKTGIMWCMTALFGGPVKGREKGINEGFKIHVVVGFVFFFLFVPSSFLDNTWIYNLGVKIKLGGLHHGDLILLAVSFLHLQNIWPLAENIWNLSVFNYSYVLEAFSAL